MNMQAIVQALIAGGLTQTEIATKCGCTQGRISEIANGKAKTVTFELGMALVDLHKRMARKARAELADTKTTEA